VVAGSSIDEGLVQKPDEIEAPQGNQADQEVPQPATYRKLTLVNQETRELQNSS
jgi:hypothetical protein